MYAYRCVRMCVCTTRMCVVCGSGGGGGACVCAAVGPALAQGSRPIYISKLYQSSM